MATLQFYALSMERKKKREENNGVAAKWHPWYASQWLSWLECSSTLTKCQQNSFLSPLHMSVPSHSFPLAIIQLAAAVSSPVQCTLYTCIQFYGIEYTQCTHAGSISDVLPLIQISYIFFSFFSSSSFISFFVESNSTQRNCQVSACTAANSLTHTHTLTLHLCIGACVCVWTLNNEFNFL